MPIPAFIAKLRVKIGTDLLLVPTAAVLVRDAEDRLLVVRDQETGLWGFPGGIVEPDELPSDTAVRETWEESGVYVELKHLIGVFGGKSYTRMYKNGDQLAWVATVFSGKALYGQPQPDGIETDDAKFLSVNQLETVKFKEHARLFLAAEQRTKAGAYFEASAWQPD
jgi:8-oxo-dGTP pyrophosphatase MutT (NUDIX family)